MTARTALYELRDVGRVYRTPGGEVRAVDGVDLDVQAGELVAIEGPSGSGKTTLLQLLGALDAPTAGHVRFDGRDLGELNDTKQTTLRRNDFGFVFQSFNLIPTLTAAENVEAALVGTLDGARRRARATEVLEKVGLGKRTDHLPSRLSGGEQQRVAIARALANRPRVLLADEPTGNLDTATADEVMGLLAALARDDGVTVIVITHAADVARRAQRRVRLRDGRVVLSDDRPRAAAPRPVADGSSRCSSCGTLKGAAPSRELGECASCGKRYVRRFAGADRPWKACPDCGAERRTIGVEMACATCGAKRKRRLAHS